MERNPDNDQLVIRYLLGEASRQEHTQIEEQFFADDKFFEHLLAVEEELIDCYVRGKLPPHDREQFEKHFLASPERRRRVELAKHLMRCVSEPHFDEENEKGGNNERT